MCGAISIWRFGFGLITLILFAIIGIGCVVSPQWAMKHFGNPHLLGGGELRREWNSLQITLFGVVFGGFGLYGSYLLLRGCF